MARMGDWRNNKDEEIELDGIGGVSIFVKADVHRSGELQHSEATLVPPCLRGRTLSFLKIVADLDTRHQLPVLCL